MVSFHPSKSPLVSNAGNNPAVCVDGGLNATSLGRMSRLPRIKDLYWSSTQPNCLCASSAVELACSSLTQVVVYVISSSILVTATPCMDICLRNSSLDVTAVRGMVNSRTPSFGRCKRITIASPTSTSCRRLTTYRSLWYITFSSISPSAFDVRMYTPPLAPRK